MSYKGIVKGNLVELERGAQLSEGTVVEVIPKESDKELLYRKGSPQALLAALDTPASCTEEEVDVLMEAIEAGKQAVHFRGIFDRKE